jgi:hypothetical protein
MCINPSARHCECPTCADEKATVNRMRNSYATIDSNSLVRWMNSAEWIYPHDSSAGARGAVHTRYDDIWNNQVQGEINA